MKVTDLTAFADGIAQMIRERVEQVTRRVDELFAKLADVPTRAQMYLEIATKIEHLPQPKDYTSEIESLRCDARHAVAEINAAIEALPLDTFATIENVTQDLIETRSIAKHDIEAAVAAIEIAQPPTLDEIVASVVKSITLPTPRDGVDGKSVTLDDVRPLFEAGFAKWALEFERRALERADVQIAAALAKIVQPKDGLDGLGFEDLSVEYDGERTFALVFDSADIEQKRFEFVLPFLIYREVYSEGQTYQRGDAVTWGGQVYIAMTQTKSQPRESHDWRLAVKKGRDGRDGRVLDALPTTVAINKQNGKGK